MADEPERRVVGALHAELERQSKSKEGDAERLYLGVTFDSTGVLLVDGLVDLHLLARAVLAEIKENPL